MRLDKKEAEDTVRMAHQSDNKFMTFPYYHFDKGSDPVSMWDNQVCSGQKRTFWTSVVPDSGTNSNGPGVIGNCGCIGAPNGPDGCATGQWNNDYWNFLSNDPGVVGTPMKITVDYKSDVDHVTVSCARMEDQEDSFQGSCP